jgi:hypothetical protein
MTHWIVMFGPLPKFVLWPAAMVLTCTLATGGAQTIEEDYNVYSEHPRLILKPQRLRLLRRERERQSQRWLQFEALVQGGAQMPEPGFAFALFYQVAGDENKGRQAVRFATGASSEVRQAALVYDWCQPLLSASEKAAIETRLKRTIADTAPPAGFAAARDRAFAAAALGDADPNAARTLQTLVQKWWRGGVAPGLKNGKLSVSHSDFYPLVEILHAVRDNLNIELRDDALPFFRDIPGIRLLGYYPARYPAAENDYRIPYYSGKGEPDLKVAALSRAAEFALVAYDTNAEEHQFVQGWLMHDSFNLRGPFGSPYEFLWANPYQPGLSFYHMPLQFHDERSGRFFVRSSWDEDASWLGYSDGRAQIFEKGKIQSLALTSSQAPVIIGEAAIVVGRPSMDFEFSPDGAATWFILGLKPNHPYDLEVDDEDLAEARTDAGGILRLSFARKDKTGVRITERRP